MRNKLFLVTLFIAVFCLSVQIRAPHFSRPLNDPYDTPMAMSLVVLENWQEGMGWKSYFTPLLTFPGLANLYIWGSGARAMDQSGSAYYISAPPFSWMLAGFAASLLDMQPSKFFLQMLNLFLHLIGCVFLLCLCSRLCENSMRGRIAALLAVTVYIFNPLHLWVFDQSYSWHIIWINFWIITLYLFHRQLHAKRISRTRVTGLAIANFLLVYTDFQGLFCSAALLIIAVVARKSVHRLPTLISAIILSTFAALALAVIQYAMSLGWSELTSRLSEQAHGRSLLEAAPDHLMRLADSYTWFYTGETLVLLVLFAFLLFMRNRFSQISIDKGAHYVITASVIGALSQHIFMLNWSANHPESVLRIGIPLCLALCIGYSAVFSMHCAHSIYVSVVFITLLFTSICISYSLDTYDSYAKFMDRFNVYENLGKNIGSTTKSNEVAFAISNISLYLPLSFYAQRNIHTVTSLEQAQEFLLSHPLSNGRLFYIDNKGQIAKIESVAEVSRHDVNPPG